jgi:two-component system sensor histidine kinase RegB
VPAGELERSLAGHNQAAGLLDDARLIRAEIDRCRRLLESLAGQSGGEPAGQAPQQTSLSAVLARITERLTRADAARVDVTVAADATVVWPVEIVATAVANLIRNGLQASPPTDASLSMHGTAPTARFRSRLPIAVPACRPINSRARASRFSRPSPRGKGPGLASSSRESSIEQLGGRLVLSSSPGAGTIAQVTLPADVVAARTNHV